MTVEAAIGHAVAPRCSDLPTAHCSCGFGEASGVRTVRAGLALWGAIALPLGGLLLGALLAPGDAAGALAGGCGLMVGAALLRFSGGV